jgi:hypothetical protein
MQRGRRRAIGLVLAMAGLAAGAACSQNARDSAPASLHVSDNQRVPRQYLVTLAPGVDVSAITNVYGRFGIKRTQDLGRNLFLLTLTEDPGPTKMEELRTQNEQIKAVQPNFVYMDKGLRNSQ